MPPKSAGRSVEDLRRVLIALCESDANRRSSMVANRPKLPPACSEIPDFVPGYNNRLNSLLINSLWCMQWCGVRVSVQNLQCDSADSRPTAFDQRPGNADFVMETLIASRNNKRRLVKWSWLGSLSGFWNRDEAILSEIIVDSDRQNRDSLANADPPPEQIPSRYDVRNSDIRNPPEIPSPIPREFQVSSPCRFKNFLPCAVPTSGRVTPFLKRGWIWDR
jgi:hypothetical protein